MSIKESFKEGVKKAFGNIHQLSLEEVRLELIKKVENAKTEEDIKDIQKLMRELKKQIL